MAPITVLATRISWYHQPAGLVVHPAPATERHLLNGCCTIRFIHATRRHRALQPGQGTAPDRWRVSQPATEAGGMIAARTVSWNIWRWRMVYGRRKTRQLKSGCVTQETGCAWRWLTLAATASTVGPLLGNAKIIVQRGAASVAPT
jgi:hypothetical protein